jgi:two-component system cell cycle response regulator DivK
MARTLLVIEDNEQNLYLMKFLLEHSGYKVVSASNGPDGLRKATENPPLGILLDIQLPGMDGYAVARALRSNVTFRHTPIIAVSSYAMVGDRERGLEAGCTGYIEKPINADTFVGEIEKFLPAR